MVSLLAMVSLLDFKWMSAKAIRAPGDVICTLTMSPSLIAEHLVLS